MKVIEEELTPETIQKNVKQSEVSAITTDLANVTKAGKKTDPRIFPNISPKNLFQTTIIVQIKVSRTPSKPNLNELLKERYEKFAEEDLETAKVWSKFRKRALELDE